MKPEFVQFRDVNRALGGGTARTLRALCVRHGIPVVSLNKRVLALAQPDFQRLLDRAAGKAEVA